jgi:hypothetical protein
MDNIQLEKLNKFLSLIKKGISPEELEQFLILVLDVIQKTRTDFDNISKINISQIDEALLYIESLHSKTLSEIDVKNSKVSQTISSMVAEVQKALAEVKAIEVKDGINGKDADEEAITQNVLKQIKLPEYKEVILDNAEQIVSKINTLPLESEFKIDAFHIKNLPASQPTALTTQLTTITATAPGTPDYTIQDLTNAGGYGFVTADEGQSFLKVVLNLQTRVAELETKLQALGLLA